MKKYLIFIIILTLNVKVFSQTDTLINSKIIFLEKKETLNEQLEEFKGKIIYIDTWATYCSPCIKWLKKKKNYENYFHDNEIVVLCLCFDKLEKQDRCKTPQFHKLSLFRFISRFVVKLFHYLSCFLCI